MEYIDFGTSVFTEDAIRRIPPGAVCDLSEFQTELSREGDLAGLEVNARFYEVGTPAGIAELTEHLSSAGGNP